MLVYSGKLSPGVKLTAEILFPVDESRLLLHVRYMQLLPQCKLTIDNIVSRTFQVGLSLVSMRDKTVDNYGPRKAMQDHCPCSHASNLATDDRQMATLAAIPNNLYDPDWFSPAT